MAEYIQITDSIIALVKLTSISSYADGLSKLNIIHHFITDLINTQIHALKFMANTTPLTVPSSDFDDHGLNLEIIADMESNDNTSSSLKEEILNLPSIPNITINDYEAFVEARNFYLSDQEFQRFGKLQKYMKPLLKQTELYYYLDCELDDIPGLLKDIENKIKYIDDFHDDIENELGKTPIEVNKVSYDKCQSTYNILNYMYDLYSCLLSPPSEI